MTDEVWTTLPSHTVKTRQTLSICYALQYLQWILEDISEDVLPNEATGFKISKIWGMLYSFQKDAAYQLLISSKNIAGVFLLIVLASGKLLLRWQSLNIMKAGTNLCLCFVLRSFLTTGTPLKDNYVNNPISWPANTWCSLSYRSVRKHGKSNGLDLARWIGKLWPGCNWWIAQLQEWDRHPL